MKKEEADQLIQAVKDLTAAVSGLHTMLHWRLPAVQILSPTPIGPPYYGGWWQSPTVTTTSANSTKGSLTNCGCDDCGC